MPTSCGQHERTHRLSKRLSNGSAGRGRRIAVAAVRLLRSQWQRSCERLATRLAGLTDEEYRWEPVAGCWNVRASAESPTGWTVDYPEVHPDPPHFGVAWSASRVLSVLIDEQVHHGAEIALLRDLYRNRPLVT
jgi:hypothetical protein